MSLTLDQALDDMPYVEVRHYDDNIEFGCS